MGRSASSRTYCRAKLLPRRSSSSPAASMIVRMGFLLASVPTQGLAGGPTPSRCNWRMVSMRRATRQEHLVAAAEARLEVRADRGNHDPQVGLDHPAVDPEIHRPDLGQADVARALLAAVAAPANRLRQRPQLRAGLIGRHGGVHARGKDDLDLLRADLLTGQLRHHHGEDLPQRAVAREILHDQHDPPGAAGRQQLPQGQLARRLGQGLAQAVRPIVPRRRQRRPGHLLERPVLRQENLERPVRSPRQRDLRHRMTFPLARRL